MARARTSCRHGTRLRLWLGHLGHRRGKELLPLGRQRLVVGQPAGEHRLGVLLPAVGLVLPAGVLLVDELPDKAFCLVHHDLHPGNLMWGHVQENVSDRDHCNNQEKPGKYQFKVIDWEYAGKGCPWLDIAMVCRYWNQSADQILRAELPVTRGKTLAQVSEVLNLAGQVNTLIEKLWLAVRQETES